MSQPTTPASSAHPEAGATSDRPRLPGSRILGTGHYLPSRVLTNTELERMVDTSDQWITERTGIRERHLAAEGEVTSDMAAAAARLAIEAAGLAPTDIDLILVATITPDVPMPATAMFVQQKIGARPNTPGFDIAAACAGFIYGLSIADAYIRAGNAKYVLLVGVELLSRVLDWEDRSTCVLFGDGAGAVVVGPAEAGEGAGILSTHIYADGSLSQALCIPAGGSKLPASEQTVRDRLHYVHMVGKDVFKFAVRSLVDASLTALQANHLQPTDIDWVIPHQANIRIIDGVAKRCGIPEERFYINIDCVGNTSSASIPIALDETVRKGLIRKGQRLLFCALGGGIAWGSAVVRW